MTTLFSRIRYCCFLFFLTWRRFLLVFTGRSKQEPFFVFWMIRYQSCSIVKGVLRNFAKFTGKHVCQSLFFNKVAGVTNQTTKNQKPQYK